MIRLGWFLIALKSNEPNINQKPFQPVIYFSEKLEYIYNFIVLYMLLFLFYNILYTDVLVRFYFFLNLTKVICTDIIIPFL